MTEPKPTCEDPSFRLSKEDTAFFIRNLWEALITPTWTRDDIIELGKAVFAKVPLSKLDDKRFNQLLPYLTKMSENLALKIHSHILDEQDAVIAAARSFTATPPKATNPPPKNSRISESLQPDPRVSYPPPASPASITEVTSAPEPTPAEPSHG